MARPGLCFLGKQTGHTELSMRWPSELQINNVLGAGCYFPVSLLACFRKQYCTFLPVWRSNTGLQLILLRICWEVCALYFKIWSSSECNTEIISMVSALTAGVSLSLSASDMSSIPVRLSPQHSLSNAQTWASFLELGLHGHSWAEISRFHPEDCKGSLRTAVYVA